MPAIARIGDLFSCGDIVATGATTVFANGIPISRKGDITTGHSLPGHTFYAPVPILTGSTTVFVEGLPIAKVGDILDASLHCDVPHPAPDCHPGSISVGSPNVNAT